jgi:hypothetical protein
LNQLFKRTDQTGADPLNGIKGARDVGNNQIRLIESSQEGSQSGKVAGT